MIQPLVMSFLMAPGNGPGMEGNVHNILADIKAFTEATVPAHA